MVQTGQLNTRKHVGACAGAVRHTALHSGITDALTTGRPDALTIVSDLGSPHSPGTVQDGSAVVDVEPAPDKVSGRVKISCSAAHAFEWSVCTTLLAGVAAQGSAWLPVELREPCRQRPFAEDAQSLPGMSSALGRMRCSPVFSDSRCGIRARADASCEPAPTASTESSTSRPAFPAAEGRCAAHRIGGVRPFNRCTYSFFFACINTRCGRVSSAHVLVSDSGATQDVLRRTPSRITPACGPLKEYSVAGCDDNDSCEDCEVQTPFCLHLGQRIPCSVQHLAQTCAPLRHLSIQRRV